jgi:hypothetical protein
VIRDVVWLAMGMLDVDGRSVKFRTQRECDFVERNVKFGSLDMCSKFSSLEDLHKSQLEQGYHL